VEASIMSNEPAVGTDFIRQIITRDVQAGKSGGRVVTRFPPEPNGYLHIGHARSICLNFEIAAEFGGCCHLRFDDTNPSAEEQRYVDAIERDVRWLGFDWGEHRYHASDYFEKLYGYAEQLIRRGLAFVCDLSPEAMREYNGTLTEAGRPSPYRDRSVDENLDLFARMRAGEFGPGARVLRAKIDLASSVLPMRDPILYRIQHTRHHRTGDTWHIYPLYDFAHGLSDAIEGITHSLCTLEFTDHRPLYDWILAQLDIPDPPQQIEFARLNLSHTVLSKRLLRRLVEEECVSGWDDPRMPTISGMRRRGYPAAAVRAFCDDVGLSKRDNLIQLARLEHHVRESLNRSAPRAMAVLRPLRVVIENYPEDQCESFSAVNNPEDPSAGHREVPFSRVVYIERDDFLEDPPGKFFRLAPGREVRLRYACLIRCTGVVKDAAGEIVELRCEWDPASRGGNAPGGRRVKGTLHWVSAAQAIPLTARLYGPLFAVEDPDATGARLTRGGRYRCCRAQSRGGPAG
jgi:glutaminyl-tRNA synthetase